MYSCSEQWQRQRRPKIQLKMCCWIVHIHSNNGDNDNNQQWLRRNMQFASIVDNTHLFYVYIRWFIFRLFFFFIFFIVCTSSPRTWLHHTCIRTQCTVETRVTLALKWFYFVIWLVCICWLCIFVHKRKYSKEKKNTRSRNFVFWIQRRKKNQTNCVSFLISWFKPNYVSDARICNIAKIWAQKNAYKLIKYYIKKSKIFQFKSGYGTLVDTEPIWNPSKAHRYTPSSRTQHDPNTSFRNQVFLLGFSFFFGLLFLSFLFFYVFFFHFFCRKLSCDFRWNFNTQTNKLTEMK